MTLSARKAPVSYLRWTVPNRSSRLQAEPRESVLEQRLPFMSSSLHFLSEE